MKDAFVDPGPLADWRDLPVWRSLPDLAAGAWARTDPSGATAPNPALGALAGVIA